MPFCLNKFNFFTLEINVFSDPLCFSGPSQSECELPGTIGFCLTDMAASWVLRRWCSTSVAEAGAAPVNGTRWERLKNSKLGKKSTYLLVAVLAHHAFTNLNELMIFLP